MHTAIHQRDNADYDGPEVNEWIRHGSVVDGGSASKAFVDVESMPLDDVICMNEAIGIGRDHKEDWNSRKII